MRLMRKLHEWFGLLTLVVVVIVSVTGVLLVHKKSLGLDKVSFNLPGYAVPPTADAWETLEVGEHLIVTTKQGVFVRVAGAWRGTLPVPVRQLVLHETTLYAAAKDGLHRSVDQGLSWDNLLPGQEVRAAVLSGGELLAATTSGLLRASGETSGTWTEVVVFGKKPLDVRRIQPLGDELLLAAKEGLFHLGEGGALRLVGLPLEESAVARVSLQRLVTDLHNGDFFGRLGYLAIDATGVALVLLSLTGVYLWYVPWKKRRQAARSRGEHL
ncbi:PepSY domain-containing protein [Geoalkalibacter sp.]|uniref:PepSY domain-containing protein n=1 Tax=Geoalkalibacter sp. TaxID=3041440 RepID=UPI00272ED48A|nr:PepSY domain-containing protein [Geoalkalibacter sp.]